MKSIKYIDTALAYWKFNESSGSTIYDSTTNGKNATANGTTIVNGYEGSARQISVDAVDFIYYENLLSSNTNFTICGWFKVNPSTATTVQYANCLAGFTTKSATGINIGVSTGSTKYYAINYYNGSLHISDASTIPVVNDWVHLALTKDGSTVKLFVNGVLAKVINITHNAGLHFYTCYVNDNNYFGDVDFIIDELIIWNSTLTETQINEVYNSYFIVNKILILSNDNKVKSLKTIGGINHLTELPSYSEQNFINYGMDSSVQLDGIFSSKNYILSKEDSEIRENVRSVQINRKPLSIKFN